MITNKARLDTAFLALKEEEWIVLLKLNETSSLSAADYIAVIWGLHVRSNMRYGGIGDN